MTGLKQMRILGQVTLKRLNNNAEANPLATRTLKGE